MRRGEKEVHRRRSIEEGWLTEKAGMGGEEERTGEEDSSRRVKDI